MASALLPPSLVHSAPVPAPSVHSGSVPSSSVFTSSVPASLVHSTSSVSVPAGKVGSAYFKSTDGHHGQWAFSTRRLNLGVLEVVGRYGGCVIVDSTRRGKSMPDALSKTVPIWCAVLNRALFPDRPDAHALHTPPRVVGASEHAQIEERLDGFVQDFKALHLPLPPLRAHLTNPLRPLWVTPDSTISEHPPSFEHFHPVVCCTASRRADASSEAAYVQGAGDDSEGWARGLTPALFWANYETLLQTESDAELVRMMERLAKGTRSRSDAGEVTMIKPTGGVYVGTLDDVQAAIGEKYDCVVACADVVPEGMDERLRKRVLHLKCGRGKLGSRDLRRELGKVPRFVDSRVPAEETGPAILVACASGRDLAVGVALVVLCLFFDGEGRYTGRKYDAAIDKLFIRQRLSWIVAAKQDVNPSRATLQSVNAFLMQRTP